MLSLHEVLEKDIRVPIPRGNFSEEEKKRIFATNRGWMKMREDGRSEMLIVLRNLDIKIKDLMKTQKIPADNLHINNIEEQTIQIAKQQSTNENNIAVFDYVELENGIEDKKLKKGNLIRAYLVWDKPINIKANDGLKSYIQIFNDKDKLLGNAYYRERVNEKTLMFVYKLGKEKINGIIKINPVICDGRIKDNNGNIILNPDKLLSMEGIFANIE